MEKTFAKFDSVSFKNVLVFKDEFKIPLSNQGVISVIGINKDTNGSNGAGKSTIFDILRAVHLGKVADGTPDIQFLSNKGSSYINYVASYGKNTYDITKYRNDKVYKNNTIILKNDKPIGAKKNAVALRKEISEDYIKLSEAVWDNCVVLRTDKAHTLLQGTPSERIEFISNICQLNAYDELEEKLKDDLKKVSTSIDELRETQALYADVSKSLGESASKKEIKAKLQSLEEKKKLLSKKVSLALDNRNECTSKSDKISTLIKENQAIEKYSYEGNYKSVSKELSNELDKMETYKSKVSKLSSALEAITRRKTLKEKIKNLMAPEKSKEHYEEKVFYFTKQNKSMESDLEKAKEAYSLYQFLKTAKNYSLDDLKNKLAEANTKKIRLDLLMKLSGHKYDKCPLCEQVLKNAIDIDKGQLKKDIAEVDERIENLSNKIEYAKSVEYKQERYNELKDYNYKELKSRFDFNQSKIDHFKEVIIIKEREKGYLDDLAEVEKKLEGIDLDNIEDNITKFQSKYNESKQRTQDLNTLKVSLKRIESIENELGISSTEAEKELSKTLEQAEEYENKYNKKNEKLNNVLHKIGEYSNSLKTVESLLKKKEKYENDLAILPKLEKKKKFLEALVYCYSNKGLKATKISKILEALSIRLQEYTSILFSEKDIEFEVTATSNSFSMMCVRKDNKGNVIAKYDAKRLSSGERARFTLSLVFALDDITSPNQRCNFKVLDEVDAKLDEKGKRVLLERFIPILKSKCDTLFIVSHDKEVRDSNIFNKRLIVTKKDAKSTIKLVEVKNVQD